MASDEDWERDTAQFFRENYEWMYSAAMFMCRNHHDARDLVSATMEKVAKAWFSSTKRSRAWVHKIMVNTFLDDIKKPDSRHREVPLSEGDPGWVVDDPELTVLNRDQATAFVKAMSEEERKVLGLLLQGKTYEEIGAALYVSKSKVHKIRSKFRERAAAAGLDIENEPVPRKRWRS